MNLDREVLPRKIARIYHRILPASTVLLAMVLLWFAFVYYPKVIDDYKVGNFPKRSVIGVASAVSYQFPIVTLAFTLEADSSGGSYYALIQGQTLEEYVVNRDGAKLALKTALSAQSLCDFNVIYVSAARLSIPDKFRADC